MAPIISNALAEFFLMVFGTGGAVCAAGGAGVEGLALAGAKAGRESLAKEVDPTARRVKIALIVTCVALAVIGATIATSGVALAVACLLDLYYVSAVGILTGAGAAAALTIALHVKAFHWALFSENRPPSMAAALS